MDRGGLVGADGATHQGAFDLTYLRTVPNFVVMAPKDENELQHMIKTAINHQSGPIAFRYPRGEVAGRSAGLRRARGAVDHGIFLALRSVRRDLDDDPPRNKLLALADRDVQLHDHVGVPRLAGDLPSRNSIRLKCLTSTHKRCWLSSAWLSR